MNIATNLEWASFFFPGRPVLSEGDSQISYGMLNEKVNRVATALIGFGIQPGESIGICAPNCGDWVAFYFGVLKAGAVAVTLSNLLSDDELSFLLNHCQPRVIYASDDKLNCLDGFRGSGGIETVICPGSDLDMNRLLKLGSRTFKALDRDRKTLRLFFIPEALPVHRRASCSATKTSMFPSRMLFSMNAPRIKTGPCVFCRSIMSLARCIS